MKIITSAKTAISLLTLICLLILNLKVSIAQVISQHQTSEERGHKVTIGIGHAHAQEGLKDGEKKWITMGTWAINYDYLFNSKWSIGSHNDIIIEDITVEKHFESEEEKEIEHEVPVATKLVGSFKPGKHTSFILGVGDEIAKGEHLLSTIGLEYSWHLTKGWELGGGLSYDVKWKAYDNWILGFGISKTIPTHHKKI